MVSTSKTKGKGVIFCWLSVWLCCIATEYKSLKLCLGVKGGSVLPMVQEFQLVQLIHTLIQFSSIQLLSSV